MHCTEVAPEITLVVIAEVGVHAFVVGGADSPFRCRLAHARFFLV